jgi:hypothetical protein
MELTAKFIYPLLRYDTSQSVISWRVDVHTSADDEIIDLESGPFLIGRMLADEVRRFEVAEWGEDPYQVADSDSDGLEVAYRSLLDPSGQFVEEEFDGAADPVVYLYRFALHPDFAAWRLPVLDAFCRLFSTEAIILAQFHTTQLTQAEFGTIGFKPWTPVGAEPPVDVSDIYERTRFMVRDNSRETELQIADYPSEAPGATAEHSKWVHANGPWKNLC